MSGLLRGNWSSTSNSNQNNSNKHPSDHHRSDIHRTVHSIKTKREIHEYDRICRVDPANRQLVEGFTRMVTDRVDDGWSSHFLTFLFSQLPGPRSAVIQSMKDELYRVYSTFVTRTHRKPRTASSDELPFLIGAADLPVYKRDRDILPARPLQRRPPFPRRASGPARYEARRAGRRALPRPRVPVSRQASVARHAGCPTSHGGSRAGGRLRVQDGVEGTRFLR